jgi:hypothetical protein
VMFSFMVGVWVNRRFIGLFDDWFGFMVAFMVGLVSWLV